MWGLFFCLILVKNRYIYIIKFILINKFENIEKHFVKKFFFVIIMHMCEDYCQSKENVLSNHNSSMQGLSFSDAKNRLQKNGKNLITGKKKKSEFVKFLGQFKDVLIIVLIVSCAISIVIGAVERSVDEFIDAGIILLVVMINAIIGYVQERKSEQAMQALKNMTKPFCKVIRDGVINKIKSEELVVGDIVVIEAGDIVPADLRLLESQSLKIEESALTGESEPVEKDAEVVLKKDTILAERKNMAFMGSVVTYGRGIGVVSKVGMQTEMGKIASALDEIKDEDTPLTKRIRITSIYLTVIVLIITVIIFIINVVMGASAFSAFSMAIAIAVCAIPEGLPACVTVTMSMGVKRMSEQRAIVKKLPAVETLGSTEVICSDKTGTLTLNKMTVKKAFMFDDKLEEFNKIDFSHKNSQDDLNAENLVKTNKTIQEFVRTMVLCNDVQIKMENENLICVGDPTEVALVYAGYAFGAGKDLYEGMFKRVNELPFDSDRKMMSTINDVNGENYVYTKGALDSILERCSKVLVNGKIRKMTDIDKEEILKQNQNLASDALRVLALAFKKQNKDIIELRTDIVEKDLVFVGLVGMIDPPRKEVKDAIKTCKEAGIQVIMITGDHKDTAFAIAKELGICENKKKVITGDKLSKLSDEKFAEIVNEFKVYARVSPEHKVKIVKALKANNKVVAMTGDGVNDAPSIKAADIGVGMGITGTDVTKEAADIILTDDNFATIVGAVKEGRKIYQGILKILEFLLGTSFAELIAVAFITCVFGFFNPEFSFFTPALLLWINFVSDTFVGLALGFEKADKNIMKEPPQKTTGNLFKGKVGFNIFCSAVYVSLFLIGLYTILTFVFDMQSEHVTTICFLYICFAELFHAYNLKSDNQSLFSSNPFDNKVLNYGFLISAILTIIIVALPIVPIQNALGICMIDWWEWLLALGLAILIIPYMEIIKLIIRCVKKRRTLKNEK